MFEQIPSNHGEDICLLWFANMAGTSHTALFDNFAYNENWKRSKLIKYEEVNNWICLQFISQNKVHMTRKGSKGIFA